MKVNYDQKYINPNKTTSGSVRQILTSQSTDDSSLKTYYHVQSQSRLKVRLTVHQPSYRLFLLKNRKK